MTKIDVVDLLLHAQRFDEHDFAHPFDTEDFGRTRFFANSMIIHTFAHGGQNIRVKKHRIRWRPDDKAGMIEEIVRVLNCGTMPVLFQRGGSIGIINGHGAFTPIDADYLPVLLGQVFEFFKVKTIRGETREVHHEVPVAFWKAFLKQPQSRLPELKAIMHCPYPFGDEIVQKQGYDFRTGIYLTQDFDIKLPPNIGEAEARASLEYLRLLLAGFEFADAVSEMVIIGTMLAGIQRHLLGTCPGTGVDGNAAGTGKTQSLDGISIVLMGEPAKTMPYRSGTDEQAKAMLALLSEAPPFVVIDNVPQGVPFISDTLCMVLASPTFSDRKLGENKSLTFDTSAIQFGVTGINLRIGGDLHRRFVMCRMDVRSERPEERHFDKTFTQLCRENRLEILKALLTIVIAFRRIRPDVNVKSLGSFENWTNEVAAPIKWLTGLDLSDARPKAVDDEGKSLIMELLTLWYEELGSKAFTIANACDASANIKAWVIENFPRGLSYDSRKVGNFFSRYKGQVFDGMRIVPAPTLLHKVTQWQIERLPDKRGDGG
jgi:putative DNA primase/helicase